MNYLAIDYGIKRIGLAICIQGVISPLKVIDNNKQTLDQISQIIDQYKIEKIFVGLPEWGTRPAVLSFVKRLSAVVKLEVETVEESVSTIEAESIFKSNKKNRKKYKSVIDSISAAVILRRAVT